MTQQEALQKIVELMGDTCPGGSVDAIADILYDLYYAGYDRGYAEAYG